MVTPNFFGKIKDGHIVHQDPELFEQYVIFNFKEDQEVAITVKKKKKVRSTGQPDEEGNINGYYWAVIVRMVGNEIGEVESEVVHDLIQMETGNVKVVRGIKLPAGTSDMDGGQFSDYCSRARIWANQALNIFIPEPHEAEYQV